MQQLDIFADSASVQRANDLIAALADFEHTAAQSALRNLAAVDPHHAGLTKYRLLCDFVGRWADGCNDPDWPHTPSDITAEEQLIREQIIPAATVMGCAGDELVRKCWLVLAKAFERMGISPEHADLFAAELYLRARQFSDAVRAAQQVSGADMRPAVQRWLGLGFYGCGKTKPAREAALRYAWLAPRLFDAFVDETGDTKLARDWSEFQADLGDLDATWFPAWCTHEKKIGAATPDNLPASDGCAAYRLVTNLAIRERGGLCNEVYENRARLKQLNENFFAFYMRRRSDLHARI